MTKINDIKNRMLRMRRNTTKNLIEKGFPKALNLSGPRGMLVVDSNI